MDHGMAVVWYVVCCLEVFMFTWIILKEHFVEHVPGAGTPTWIIVASVLYAPTGILGMLSFFLVVPILCALSRVTPRVQKPFLPEVTILLLLLLCTVPLFLPFIMDVCMMPLTHKTPELWPYSILW